MNNISIKEYMDLAKERLEGLSAEDLQAILLEQAKKAKPSERIFFLQSLTPPPKREVEEAEPDDELLDEILDFSERVENGNYCTGWGWDNEIRQEREWGDKSWADEADDFFKLIRDEYEDGHFELAAKAYEEAGSILQQTGNKQLSFSYRSCRAVRPA